MKRYIDADELLKRFKELHGNESELLNCYNAEWIIQFIEGQPTADVQEVRHGRWKEDEETGCLQCSECGHLTDEILGDFICVDEKTADALSIPKGTVIHRSMHPFYCSRCGAKMDGGGKDSGN